MLQFAETASADWFFSESSLLGFRYDRSFLIIHGGMAKVSSDLGSHMSLV